MTISGLPEARASGSTGGDGSHDSIEGTLAQGVYGYDARRTRYRTLARVHLQHVALAAAISLQRLDDWWTHHHR